MEMGFRSPVLPVTERCRGRGLARESGCFYDLSSDHAGGLRTGVSPIHPLGALGILRILLAVTSAVLLFAAGAPAQLQYPLNLMPVPANVQLGAGQLPINQA